MLIRNFVDAEEAAARWMSVNGFPDAVRTRSGADGGVDVRATGAVAQVKAEVAKVGAPVVRQLFGVATVEGVMGLVFALGGFTAEARSFADRAGVALFTFDLQSDVVPVNQAAEAVGSGTSPRVLDRLEGAAAAVGIHGRLDGEDDDLCLLRRVTPEGFARWVTRFLSAAAAADEDEFGKLYRYPLKLDLAAAKSTACAIELRPDLFDSDQSLFQLNWFGQALAQVSLEGIPVTVAGWSQQEIELRASTPSQQDRFVAISVGVLIELAAMLETTPSSWRVTGVPGIPVDWDAYESADPPAGPIDEAHFRYVDEVLSRKKKVVLESASSWRHMRVELESRESNVYFRVVAEDRWNHQTPGGSRIKRQILLHLPGTRIQCPTAPERSRFMESDPEDERVEAVIVRFLIDRSQVPLALAILAEALTLGPEELVVG